MTRFSELNRSSQLIILIGGLLALAVTVAAWSDHPTPRWGDLFLFLLLAGLAAVRRIHLTPRLGTISVGNVVVVATLLYLGLPEALLAALVSGVAGCLISQRTGRLQPLHRILFAAATVVLTTYAAGRVFTRLGGVPGAPVAQLLWPTLPATLTYFLVNTGLVALIMAASEQALFFSLWRERFAWAWPGYLAASSAAILGGWLYQRLDLVGLALAAPFLYLIYHSYKLHAAHQQLQADLRERTEEQEAIAARLSATHRKTVQALARSLELWDPAAHAHALRVQRWAVAVAKEMELTSRETQAVRWAALLHDIGMLAQPLTPEEQQEVEQHPRLGSEMLAPFDFPWPLADLVRSHHEWWDGTGYPDQLVGSDIPLGARILAVAEAFAELVADRPDRAAVSADQAAREIAQREGTQFDPQVVQAFLRVIARQAGISVEELLSGR